MQVWLEVVAIGSCKLFLSLIQSHAAVPGGRISNSTTSPSANVRHFKNPTIAIPQQNKMEKEIETFYPRSRQEWRDWLQDNHDKKQCIWLIYYKKKSNIPTVIYSEAVDEALCFGWIDSKAKPLDEHKFMQFFSRRKERSVWSKVNKEKVTRLTIEGLMTKAGYEIIETAKQNGSWTILDEAEALIIPKDLDKEFQRRKNAKEYFLSLSRWDKRNILQWLVLAKRQETREKRITEIVELADKKQKPKQFGRQKDGI